MKKELIGKIITIIIIAMMIFAMTTNVFAATSEDDFWDPIEVEGEEGNQDESGVIPPVEDDSKNETPAPTPAPNNTTTGNSYTTDLPHAGAAENTIMAVAVTVLAIVAIVAYRKMKYYKNV